LTVFAQKLAFQARDFTHLLEGCFLNPVLTTRPSFIPVGQQYYPSHSSAFLPPQFSGEADSKAKAQASQAQREEFERANALAKKVRPLLPLSLQLAFPVPEHRQGVIAAHIRQMMEGLRGLFKAPQPNGVIQSVSTLTQDAEAKSAIGTLSELETRSVRVLTDIASPPSSEAEKLVDHLLLLPRLPQGRLLDHRAKMVYDSSRLVPPVESHLMDRIQSEEVKIHLLDGVLNSFDGQELLFLFSPVLHKWVDAVGSLSNVEERQKLFAKFLTAFNGSHSQDYAYSGSASDAGKLVQKMLSSSPQLEGTKQIESLVTKGTQLTQMADVIFRRLSDIDSPLALIEQLKKETSLNGYLPSINEAQMLLKKLKRPSSVRKLIEDVPVHTPAARMAVYRIVLQLPNKSTREGLFAAALMKFKASTSALQDMGAELKLLSNRSVEKQLFIQTVLSSEALISNPQLLEVTTSLLMHHMPDSAKAATIMGIAQHAKNPYSLALAKAAIFSIKNNVMRQSLLALYETTAEKQVLSKLESIQQIEQDANLSAYFQVTQKAYEPALAMGLSLDSAKKAIEVIQAAKLDAGVFNRDVLPDFSKLLSHTIKHADKLVKAGEEVPSQETIEARFKKPDEAHAILAGLVLLGRPAMEMAVERKRLDNVLASVRVLLKEPGTFSSLVACKQKAVSQFDMLKMAEMSEIFIAQKSCDALFRSLKQVAEQPKLDLAPLAKATLEEVMKKVNVSVDNIDPAQLERWNLKHINTLVKAFSNSRDKQALTDVCRAALQGKFKDYLYDPNTELGKANLATKAAFEAEGMNFDLWQNYTEVKRVTMPTKVQYAREIEQFLIQEYAALPPEKKALFESGLNYYSLGIAEDPTSGKKTLKAVRDNQPIPDNGIIRTITSLQNESYITQSLSAQTRKKLNAMISTMTNRLPESPEPLEIAVWDRNPGYDMFMGTDTGACTAIDNGNMSSIHALQNTFVQMVHLRKPGEKQAVGKILLFWSKNPWTGSLICHWNTFEGRGGAGSLYEYNYFMREQLLEFVEKYAKAVSGKEAVPIRTCDTYNPTYKEDLATEHKTCKVIGHMKPGAQYYLDTFSPSEVDISRTFKDVKLWKMNAVEIEAPKPPLLPPELPEERIARVSTPLSSPQVPAANFLDPLSNIVQQVKAGTTPPELDMSYALPGNAVPQSSFFLPSQKKPLSSFLDRKKPLLVFYDESAFLSLIPLQLFKKPLTEGEPPKLPKRYVSSQPVLNPEQLEKVLNLAQQIERDGYSPIQINLKNPSRPSSTSPSKTKDLLDT
jgi:hypothetical protein